jgi:uncharacterized protein with NAD-binding domain and iron-sulfur cluster
MDSGATKQKIAILGGGLAALSTAFELTSTPGWQDRYEVTIYQMGWRLGGKCATGRGPNGRIEEHGIHAFSGSYYNALGMMWACYRELPEAAPAGVLESFEKAFRPGDGVIVWDRFGGKLSSWPLSFAPNGMSAVDYEKSIPDIEALIQAGAQFAASRSNRLGVFFTHLGLLNRTGLLGSLLRTGWAWTFGKLPDGGLIARIRQLRVAGNYMMTLWRGLTDPKDDISKNGFDVIDDENFDDWLRRHGATEETMISPLVYNTVDLSYNYPFGDTSVRPKMAAGAYLRWTLRMFLNLGAFAWSFEAGTGETVIAPLYHVLKHRGVRFEFFHKVKALQLAPDGTSVASVAMEVQAELKNPSVPYDPLVPVQKLLCWPNHPKYDLLVQGEALERDDINLESYWTPWVAPRQTVLSAGKDYDKLVLAISIGAAPYVCAELIEHDARWRAMVENVPTCTTQTLQIWLDKTSDQMGAGKITCGQGVGDETISGTFVMPFNGVVDFTYLIKREEWPEGAPKALWYFTGAMADYGSPDFSRHDFPQQQYERVKHQSIQFLQATAGYLLPGAATDWDPLGLDFSLLTAPPGVVGVQRFESQFWRANIDPTERYVLAPPGGTKHRLEADRSGFDNLILAGDWTYNGLNVGSVEGTVMGGKLAARALCGFPDLKSIIGYRPREKAAGI